jgi:Family of unknown function (DUF6519)
MRNDITRDTHHPAKHFSRILLQQGRVQIDADFNEQVSILLDYLRVLTVDLIGPSAGPEKAWGFALLGSDADVNRLQLGNDKSNLIDWKNEKVIIGPGRYYVDGLLAQNDDFVRLSLDVIADITKTREPVVIYLDVWERHITAIEDDSIREKALGGTDTATRAKIEWSVRAKHFDHDLGGSEIKWSPAPTAGDLENARKLFLPQFATWSEKQWTDRPHLRAGIEQLEGSDDPCVSSPESVYRGLENQLYRVEIHQTGLGAARGAAGLSTATFKWSRDNGSVVASWLDDDEGALKVAGVRDHARGFAAGQWVELSDDQHDLDGIPGTLVQLTNTEAGSLTIDPDSAEGSVLGHENFGGGNPKVRRWDQEETEEISLTKGAIAIEYNTWFTLEDGVQVQFPTDQHEFRSGDYWLIPARAATRDIEWPWETKDTRSALPPHGIRHHYALLGVVAVDDDNFAVTDLRSNFTHIQPAP